MKYPYQFQLKIFSSASTLILYNYMLQQKQLQFIQYIIIKIIQSSKQSQYLLFRSYKEIFVLVMWGYIIIQKYRQQLAGMIRKLPDSVINLISAGEVIQRPYNVIKELVQNSIDAGATQININIQQGGLKVIKISDNGNGIILEDFPLLCARFATSKIKQFSDMAALCSFGFRGQALASLSYVSNLVISSKWKNDSVGHSAAFKNQKLEGKISDVPMNTGTVITASDLFVKLQSRRASLNPGQQKKRIFKLLCHFSLHYPQIRFSLLTQKGDEGIPRTANYSNKNEQKMQIFQQITKLSFDKFSYVAPCKLNNLSIEVQAIVTKINSCKGKILMLNINNRIVDNLDLFKVVEKAYSECYQSIHEDNQSFWVYLSLKVDPKLIDCNVDPTKKAVGLFASEKSYEPIKQLILNQIKKDSAIKIIKPSLTMEKGANFQDMIRQKIGISSQPQITKKQEKQNKQTENKSKTVYAFEKNRTDCKQMPLQFYSQTQTEFLEKNQSFEYQFIMTEKDTSIRNFFAECTYVGCYGLNCILIHFQNKLYMMNIVEFIPSFVGSYCQNNKLALKSVKRQINIMEQVHKFINKTKLLPQSCIQKIKDWISIPLNQEFIEKNFGVLIKNYILISYPCLGDIFIECLDQDNSIGWEVAYLICRVFNAATKQLLVQKIKDKFMSEFISAQFIENNDTLSPFNEKISNYFKNRVIPVLKTTPMKLQKQINIKKYMKQMLDLKDIYKIFERC